MLISFIVPVYNAEDYIRYCVSSLLSQSYQKIEIILVDDGSTDGSSKICDEYANADDRVRVFHQKNGGVHTARNLGIREAAGQYVLFVDADDWIERSTAEQVVKKITQSQADVVRFTYLREFENRTAEKRNTFVKEGLSEGNACRKVYRQTMGLLENEWAHPENFNYLATTCTSAYRRKLLLENEVEFEPRDAIGSFEDGLFNLKVMEKAKTFFYMDEALYHYRKTNTDSCTANYREKYMDKQLKLFAQLYEIAEKEDSQQMMEAFYSRVIFSHLEISLNALKSKRSQKEKIKEIHQLMESAVHKRARKHIELKYFPIKWKVYFLFVKCGLTFPVYLMTCAIQFLQKRG